jgi:hypothetical protein
MGPGCEAEIMRVCPDVFRLVCTVPIIACMVRRTIDELAFRYGVGPRRLFATSCQVVQSNNRDNARPAGLALTCLITRLDRVSYSNSITIYGMSCARGWKPMEPV